MFLIAISTVFLLAAGFAFGATKVRALRLSLREGVQIWATILPVMALALYLCLMMISFGHMPTRGLPAWLNLTGQLNDFESLCLLVAGLLFVSRIGYFVAFAVTIYGIERLLISHEAVLTPAFAALISCASVIVVLGDKLPWHNQSQPDLTAVRIREIVLLLACFASLIAVFASALKMGDFASWLGTYHSANINQETTSFIVLGTMIGWLVVTFGFARKYLIPSLLLPTLAMFMFLTNWPSLALLIPLTIGISLSLTYPPPRQGPATMYQA